MPDDIRSVMFYNSDSQSLFRGPLVVREISPSGPRMPMQINILCFAEHLYTWGGPRTGNVWEPLFYNNNSNNKKADSFSFK
jgi:hypothetical protein